jgi:hypothetical protein
MHAVLTTREMRRNSALQEEENAQRYWEGRKREIGLGPGLSWSEQLARITEARREYVTHAPSRLQKPGLEEVCRLTQEIAALEHQSERVSQALAGELRSHEVHGLLHPRRTQEEHVGPGLKARLFEDEPRYRY